MTILKSIKGWEKERPDIISSIPEVSILFCRFRSASLSEAKKWKVYPTCELSPSTSGCFTICGAGSKLGPNREGAVISTRDCAFLYKGRHAICLLEAFHHFCRLVIIRDTGDRFKKKMNSFVIILIKSICCLYFNKRAESPNVWKFG